MNKFAIIISQSTARDTFGYPLFKCKNLATGQIIGKAMGGGWDLYNYVLCAGICREYQQELQELHKEKKLPTRAKVIKTKSDSEWIEVDGACGDEATRDLLQALSLKMSETKVTTNKYLIILEAVNNG